MAAVNESSAGPQLVVNPAQAPSALGSSAIAGPSTAPSPVGLSKTEARREKERRSLGNELSGRRKKQRVEELKPDASVPDTTRHGADYEEDIYDPQGSQPRNFTTVRYQKYIIQTGYFSPYPISAAEDPALAASLFADMKLLTGDPSSSASPSTSLGTEPDATAGANGSTNKAGGVPRATLRAHGRTSDLFAGGLGTGEAGARGELFVCEGCFKYTKDFSSYDLHRRVCEFTHPPGRKVYEKGGKSIWEVDGAEAGLYCQNLSLFGKLFIHTKTVFFSVEDFTFYVLTEESDGKKDHVVGFFSKEKISYEGFNLNCIITFPPYQKAGYGRLMIEFSYVLTRTGLKPGTPERPLSELGLRGYVSFWSWAVGRALGELFEEVPRASKRGLEQEGLRITLDNLASRARLRVDDVALALQDSPLVRHARSVDVARSEVLVTRGLLDEFLILRRVRPDPLIVESAILL